MASLIKRGNVYYAQYMTGKRAKRVSLDTSSLQLAKEKIRQLESALYRGHDNPLPTKTPIATVVTRYIEHMCTHKTARSVQRDISYLREAFGPICPALELKNPKISLKGKKRPPPHPLLPGGKLLRADHHRRHLQLHRHPGAAQGAGPQDRQPLPGDPDPSLQLGHGAEWHQDRRR